MFLCKHCETGEGETEGQSAVMFKRHRCRFNRRHNMQRVCHLIQSRCCRCSTGQHHRSENVLLQNVLLFSQRAMLSSSAAHLVVELKFASFLCRFCLFFPPANWSNRLNRLNLSPIIKSDYRNFGEAPSQLAGDYTAGGSLTYIFSFCSIFSSVG